MDNEKENVIKSTFLLVSLFSYELSTNPFMFDRGLALNVTRFNLMNKCCSTLMYSYFRPFTLLAKLAT